MPSAFAHAFVGASLSAALPQSAPRVRCACLLGFLAAMPDLDSMGMILGIPYEHALGHRGFSHSLVFAALIAVAMSPVWKRGSVPGWKLAGLVTFLSVASHGLLDSLTDAGLGVGLLLPFDVGRYFAPWRPILTSPLSVGAFFSARGFAVLMNEIRWVGVPTAILLSGAIAYRRRRFVQG